MIRDIVERKIEIFLIKKLKELIANEDYIFSKLSDYRYGHYFINTNHPEYISVYGQNIFGNDIVFVFPYTQTIIKDRHFLGFNTLFFFHLGYKEIETITEIGLLKNEIDSLKITHDEIKDNEDMILLLPKKEQQNVIREAKLETIINEK